jgi:hypothetical protein
MIRHTKYMIANIAIQLSCLMAYTNFAVLWALYIPMIFLGLLIVIQTIGAAAAMALKDHTKETGKETANDEKDFKMNFLVSVMYFASCYQLYLVGYEIFSVIAATHVSILALTILFKGLMK